MFWWWNPFACCLNHFTRHPTVHKNASLVVLLVFSWYIWSIYFSNLNLNRTLNLISCLVCKQTFKNQGDTLKKTLTDRQYRQDTEIFNAIGQEEWRSTLRQPQAQQLPRHVDPAARTGCTGRCLCYWLVVDLPLWKIWVRQLGWWSSQYMEIQKFKNSCSKTPTRLHLMDVIPNYPHEPVRSYSYFIDMP